MTRVSREVEGQGTKKMRGRRKANLFSMGSADWIARFRCNIIIFMSGNLTQFLLKKIFYGLRCVKIKVYSYVFSYEPYGATHGVT